VIRGHGQHLTAPIPVPRLRWAARLCRVLLLSVVVGLTGCVLEYSEEDLVRSMPAPAPSISELKSEFPSFDAVEERLRVAGDAELYVLRLIRRDAMATVLYFGGNAYRTGLMGGRTAASYLALPVNLVLVDHRGYGASSGIPGIDALMADALIVYDHLRADQALAHLPLIVHGQSLGSFLAGHVAATRTLDGLVLESSVTSTEDWVAHARRQQPWWQRILVRRVDIAPELAGRGNLAVARQFDEPVLFVVGELDPLTPPEFSRALYEAAPLAKEHKELLVVPGVAHNDATASPAFEDAMRDFVERVRGDWTDPERRGAP